MKKVSFAVLIGLFCLAMLAGCSSKEGQIQDGQTQGEQAQEEQTQDGQAQDGYGEGNMGDTMHTYFFDYTVNSAYLCDDFEGYTASQEGYQLLVADVTVKNTFQESIPMFDTDFQVQWSSDADDAYDVPITYYTDAVSDQQLPSEYELAVDEERSGLLVFEVPEGEKDFSISYLELFDDNSEGDVFFVYFTAEQQNGDSAAV